MIEAVQPQDIHRNIRMMSLLGVFGLLLLVAMTASVLLGLQHYSLYDLYQAYAAPDGSNGQLILTHTRVPRALTGAAVGASLAVAGAILQALTGNPLASPSVFGINSGAVLFLMIGLSFAGTGLGMGDMVWIAFGGAAVTGGVVFLLGSRGPGGFQSVRLTLAGATVAAFSASITSAILLLDKQSLDQALFWMIGSVADRRLEHLLNVVPYIVGGLAMALLLSRSLNIVALGDDAARGLGQRLTHVRIAAVAVVVLLAGSAVAVAGPIAFVGVIVPHLTRALTGQDHRWLLPFCAVNGAILLVGADLLSRFILMPKEVPVGVATALLGVPFLIIIARRHSHGS